MSRSVKHESKVKIFTLQAYSDHGACVDSRYDFQRIHRVPCKPRIQTWDELRRSTDSTRQIDRMDVHNVHGSENTHCAPQAHTHDSCRRRLRNREEFAAYGRIERPSNRLFAFICSRKRWRWFRKAVYYWDEETYYYRSPPHNPARNASVSQKTKLVWSRLLTSIPENIEVWTASQELLPSSSSSSNLAILSLEILLNSASERFKVWKGKALYKDTNGDLRVDAMVFLVFKEGEDNFYASS